MTHIFQLAVAKDYFDNGACVILSSRKAESLEKVRDELLVNHKGREKCIKVLPLDIEDIDSFEGKVEVWRSRCFVVCSRRLTSTPQPSILPSSVLDLAFAVWQWTQSRRSRTRS